MSEGGYRYITTYLCVKGASEAIDFYTKAFGAREVSRMANDNGTLGHAEIVIGGTRLFLSDEWPEAKVLSPKTLNGNSASLVLSVDDADAAFEAAIAAGATVERPLADQEFGRSGWVVDPFGHRWDILGPTREHNAGDGG